MEFDTPLTDLQRAELINELSFTTIETLRDKIIQLESTNKDWCTHYNNMKTERNRISNLYCNEMRKSYQLELINEVLSDRNRELESITVEMDEEIDRILRDRDKYRQYWTEILGER